MDSQQMAQDLMDGKSVTCPLPFFGGGSVPLELEDIPQFTVENVAATLDRFVALGQDDRAKAARHVFAYYADFYDEFGDEALSEGNVPPKDASDIWRLVTPGPLLLTNDAHHAPDQFYMVMEAECDWEPEHGLMLVWQDGNQLTKVSGYDGHVTNQNAYADPEMAGVVYHSYNGFTTRF